MSSWFTDTFTEASQTPVTSHTSDSGDAWLLWHSDVTPDTPPDVYASFGGVLASGQTNTSIYHSKLAPSADAIARAVMYYDSGNLLFAGPCLRLNAAKTAGYVALYSQDDGWWEIDRISINGSDAAVGTTLAHSSPVSFISGDTPAVDFAVVGDNVAGDVTLTLALNGVQIVSTTDTDIAALTLPGYIGVWFTTSGVAGGMFFNSLVGDPAGGPATAVTMSGPTTGAVGVASSNFTIGADGDITGTVTVTPSDDADGGTFAPTSVAISTGTPTATFTYTPISAGAKTISVTNDGSLTDPADITYTATVTGVTITVQVVDPDGAPVASATSLRWAFFDDASADTLTTPTGQGSSETTDGTGQLVISVPGSALAAGDVGYLVLSDSSGNPDVPCSGFNGPVRCA